MNVNSQAMGVEKLTKNERGCPHSGLCEGDNNSSIDVLPITSSIEIAVPLKFATVASDYSPIDNQWGNTVLSPPLKKPPSLYTLNCSFLI